MSVELDRLFAVSARANLDVECSRLDRAWEDVVVHGRDSSVRPLVLDSWNRCLRTGLDASTTRSPRVLSPEQVRDYVQANPVYAEVLPALPSLTGAAVDSQHMLVYCDADGHIMHLAGEQSILRRADRMNFVVGSHWGEDHAGTNAIGTAIITGTPVQLLGSEHYCQAVHDWTCSASPIRDPATNEVLAVIDMTGLRKSFHPISVVGVFWI
jgi:transcriptional regulator of acetoin/glycerol metabolism